MRSLPHDGLLAALGSRCKIPGLPPFPRVSQGMGGLRQSLGAAAKKAVGGGIAGAIAMVVQVFALMWLRTTINYQHAKGMPTLQAMAALYQEGGIPRFYKGLWLALIGAPLARFGDTAANQGMRALLQDILPPSTVTFCASVAAALFRIFITPVDTLKTTLQVQGSEAFALIGSRVSQEGILTLYSGALGNSLATLVGHYPWFYTYNKLDQKISRASGFLGMLRNAFIGFCSSFTSDVVSNSIRVVKTAKQTNADSISYLATISMIIAQDGVSGLFLRGLGTKILTNGIQGMLFTIVWKAVEKKIAQRQEKKRVHLEKRKHAE